MRLYLITITAALAAACGGGGDPGAVEDPQWTAEDEAEIAEVLDVVKTLGALYAKNCPECIVREVDE